MTLSNKVNVIFGDFNENYFDNRPITQALAELNFVQTSKHPTHVTGGLIDHVYVKFGISTFGKTEIYSKSVYYSNHNALQMAFLELQFC